MTITNQLNDSLITLKWKDDSLITWTWKDGVVRQTIKQYSDEYEMVQRHANFINSDIKQKVVYEDEYLNRPYIGTTPGEDKRILESANYFMDYYINQYSAKAITQEELEYKFLQGSFEERRKDSIAKEKIKENIENNETEFDYSEIDIF